MTERARSSSEWWLTALYAVLAISALALATLLIGDVIAAIESGDHPGDDEGGLHHLFIFDLAYPVFLIGSMATLVAGIGTLVASVVRQSAPLRRYATIALAFALVATAVLALTGSLEL